MNISIANPLKVIKIQLEKIGSWDKDTFYKVVDYRTQVFNRNSDPKIDESLAYSISRIKQCIRKGIKYFVIEVINHPHRPSFILRIEIEKFLKYSNEIWYKGKKNSDRQRCCKLSKWEEL